MYMYAKFDYNNFTLMVEFKKSFPEEGEDGWEIKWGMGLVKYEANCTTYAFQVEVGDLVNFPNIVLVPEREDRIPLPLKELRIITQLCQSINYDNFFFINGVIRLATIYGYKETIAAILEARDQGYKTWQKVREILDSPALPS